jgi:hypothetical protein
MSHLPAAVLFFGCHLPVCDHACHNRHRDDGADQKNRGEL